MKSIATRITATSSRIDCHAIGGPVNGVATANVSPEPIGVDATANWCAWSGTTSGTGLAIATASAGVSDVTLPVAASVRLPSTRRMPTWSTAVAMLCAMAVINPAVRGRATKAVALVPGIVDSATSHAWPPGPTAVVALADTALTMGYADAVESALDPCTATTSPSGGTTPSTDRKSTRL